MRYSSLAKTYYDWLLNIVCDREHQIDYADLLSTLFDTEFYCSFEMDKNRVGDGLDLRSRFIYEMRLSDRVLNTKLDGPCTFLEMMIALASRCELEIMSDDGYGDRTANWFWSMIHNMGLENMYAHYFDINYVSKILDDIIHRRYSREGRHNLFYVDGSEVDMRKLEIWKQMNYWLQNIDD